MTPIPRYRWLLFDADGTLFDYDRAEASALATTFAQFDLPLAPGTAHAYRGINHQCWQALERGEITPAALRTRRFELLFDAVGLRTDVERFSAAYLENLAEAAELLDGAAEMLAALRDRYRFAIITNGLRAVQRGRLARSADPRGHRRTDYLGRSRLCQAGLRHLRRRVCRDGAPGQG